MKHYFFEVKIVIEADFVKVIEHSRGIEGEVERSECLAYKIDDADGLSKHLGFANSLLSKVDYFCAKENTIQFIELTDLENDICNIKCNIQKKIEFEEQQKGNKLTTKEKGAIRKKAWSLVTNEIKRKWSGSIAIIERLYRKNKIYSDDPDYQMLIVCKNKTDIIMLDVLQRRLQGMMGTIVFCKTRNISEYLISTISE